MSRIEAFNEGHWRTSTKWRFFKETSLSTMKSKDRVGLWWYLQSPHSTADSSHVFTMVTFAFPCLFVFSTTLILWWESDWLIAPESRPMRKLERWADLAGSAGHIYGQAGTSLTTGRTSKDRTKVGKRVLDIVNAWARICKRLRSLGIDSEDSIPNLCSQAGNWFLGSLKGLQIRALDFWSRY